MIGQQLRDYTILSELGSGGMGTVYKGIDSRNGQSVAIKQLRQEQARPEVIERFKREGEALRDLNHPNIVKMLDSIDVGDQHFLVMEYVSGGDLSSHLIDNHLETERILTIAIDLADALTRAHKLKIIHRDLKPANILISEDGILHLTDFGVAHVGSQERITDTDAIVGTVDYLPPEAFTDGTFDARGDIWAFGVILFEMLTGERPFKGSSLIQVITSITSDPIPDLEVLAPTAPIALVDLVYRMLERQPQARVPSVRIIGAELEEILEGRTFNDPPQSRFSSDVKLLTMRPLHNLPLQATPFVGRLVELSELDKLIVDSSKRLVTVIAPGGMGKTRLALASAEQHIQDFADGVYFVDLARISDPNSIVNAIVEGTGLSLSSDMRTPKQQLFDFLGNKQILLLMDNFEHVLEGAGIVNEILQSAPDIQILVTSRRRLEQQGETLFHLSGMDFPEWETPDDALEYGAVKIFMNSATRANPSFELVQDNLQYVARICRLVAGMPLGIVLSASWMNVLSPAEIAEEIAHGIDFLEASGNEVPERQRSIQVVFDYSWQLLTAKEQNIFMQMSVFQGGFSRKAGQSVTGANLRDLMSLVNKSLIRRDNESGRYSIHELARQFAHAKLEGSDELDTVLDLHLNYFTSALIELSPKLKGGSNQLEAFKDLEGDLDNVRVSWHHAVETENWLALQHMVKSIWQLDNRGRENDVLDLFMPVIQQLQALQTLSDDQEHLSALLGTHFPRVGNVPLEKQEVIILNGIQLARKHQLQTAIATGLGRLGFCLLTSGRINDAEVAVDEAIAIARQIGDLHLLAWNQHRKGYVRSRYGDKEGRDLALNEGLEHIYQTSDKILLANYLFDIGFHSADKEEGLEMLLKSLQISKEIGNLNHYATHISIVMWTYMQRLEWDTARLFLNELEILAAELNSPANIAALNFAQAWYALWFDDNIQLAHDLAVDAETTVMLDSHQINWINHYRRFVGMRKVTLNEITSGLSYIKKATNYLSIRNDMFIELTLTCLNLLEIEGDKQRQVELLALRQTHPETTLLQKQLPYIVKKHNELKATLGSAEFEAAWERGKSLDLRKTIKDVLDEFYEYYGVE